MSVESEERELRDTIKSTLRVIAFSTTVIAMATAGQFILSLGAS